MQPLFLTLICYFRTSGDSYLTAEEKCRALQNSTSLRNLFEEMFKVNVGLPLQTHRYRLRTYTNCLLGTELVDWLICQQKANTRYLQRKNAILLDYILHNYSLLQILCSSSNIVYNN